MAVRYIAAPLSLLAAAAIVLLFCRDPGPADSPLTLAGVDAGLAPHDELACLFPEGAAVCIRLQRIEEADRELADCLAPLGRPAEEIRLSRILCAALRLTSRMPGVDLARPAGIALGVGSGGDPSHLVLVGVSDEAALRKATDPSWTLRLHGPYAAVGPDAAFVGAVTRRDIPVPLAWRLLDGDLSVAADAAALRGLVGWGPPLWRTPPDEGPWGSLAELWYSLDDFAELLTDLECIAASATLSEGDLSLTMRMHLAADSAAAREVEGCRSGPAGLAPVLGDDALLLVEAQAEAIPWVDLPGILAPGSAAPSTPDPTPLSACLSGLAVRMSVREGAEFGAVLRVTDPVAYAAALDRWFEALPDRERSSPVPRESGPEWRHRGIRVRSASTDLGTLSESSPDPMWRDMVRTLYGAGRMDVHYSDPLPDSGLAVATGGAGAEAAMRELIDRVQGGAAGASPRLWKEATRGFPESTCAVLCLDVGRLMPLVLRTAPLSEEQRQRLAEPPDDALLGLYVATEGTTLRIGGRVALSPWLAFLERALNQK